MSQIEAAAGAHSAPTRGEVRKRRWRKAGYTTGAVACFFSLAVGTVFGHFYWGSKFIQDHGLQMLLGGIQGNPLVNWTPERQFKNRSTMNVLILGCDHDYDNKDQIVKNTWGRSDSIMLARVDFVNKTINALTIPRDSAVRIPGYKGIHKINAAHSYGGPELTEQTIKSVFGVDADAVVSLNFEGFQQIVDQIGGVDLTVTKKLDYDDNWGGLHIHLLPGFQHMNGYQAMGFVRIRKLDSDEMRSKRQHEFLEAVRNKVKSPRTFMALPGLIDTMADNLTCVNITHDQMYTLMNFAKDLKKESIHVETLPSTEGRRFVTIDPRKSKEVIERMFFPNQIVALNISAPSMLDEEPAPKQHRKGHRPGDATPIVNTNEATPAGENNADPKPGDTNKPAPGTDTPPKDNGTSTGANPGAARATG